MKCYPFFSISLIYWLFAGILPLVALIIDFGYELGIVYARHYPALFIYPLLFGVVSVYLLSRPFAFLLSLKKRIRFNLSRRYLIIFIIIFSLFVFIVEVSGKPAIWGVKKDAIEAQLTTQRTYFNVWQDFESFFKEPPKIPNRENYDSDSDYQQADEKVKARQKEYDQIIVEAAKNSSNFSITRYFYFVSFCLQVISLVSLFITISFLCIPKLKLQIESFELPQKKDTTMRRLVNSQVLLSVSLIVASCWLFMRLSFENYKLDLYGTSGISIVGAAIFIGIAYILALIYLTIPLFISNERLQAWLNIVVMILGVVLSILIFPKISVIDLDILSYAAALLLIILIGVPWFIAYKDIFDNW